MQGHRFTCDCTFSVLLHIALCMCISFFVYLCVFVLAIFDPWGGLMPLGVVLSPLVRRVYPLKGVVLSPQRGVFYPPRGCFYSSSGYFWGGVSRLYGGFIPFFGDFIR